MNSRYVCHPEDGDPVEIEVGAGRDGLLTLTLDGTSHAVQACGDRRCLRTVRVDDRRVSVAAVRDGEHYEVVLAGVTHRIRVADARFDALLAEMAAAHDGGHEQRVVAPIPGLVVRILVAEGDTVERDQPLLILDAMKLENEILAGSAGTIGRIAVTAGEAVEKDALLLELEA